MFGVVPKSIWSKLSTPDDQNRITLQTNCLLLDDGSQKVLIESGFGGKWSDKERGFYDLERRTIVDALREVRITPEQINHVVVTHLHFDHAGGLTTLDKKNRPVPTFPNAEVFVQKVEWEDALANKSTMTKTYLRNHLDPIAAKVRPVLAAKTEREILPGIYVQPAPGHTWGQQAIFFDDGTGGGMVIFPGDVLPTVNHAGLAFSLGYDMEPYTNMLTKRSLFKQCAAQDWRIVLDHEPGDAIVRVQRDPKDPERFGLVKA